MEIPTTAGLRVVARRLSHDQHFAGDSSLRLLIWQIMGPGHSFFQRRCRSGTLALRGVVLPRTTFPLQASGCLGRTGSGHRRLMVSTTHPSLHFPLWRWNFPGGGGGSLFYADHCSQGVLQLEQPVINNALHSGFAAGGTARLLAQGGVSPMDSSGWTAHAWQAARAPSQSVETSASHSSSSGQCAELPGCRPRWQTPGPAALQGWTPRQFGALAHCELEDLERHCTGKSQFGSEPGAQPTGIIEAHLTGQVFAIRISESAAALL